MASRRRMIAWLVTVVVQTLSSVAGVAAKPWKRADVDTRPDEAFAVVHVRADGTLSRRLPHQYAEGRVDLPHLRGALARLGQVRWEDPADAEPARKHLRTHQEEFLRRSRARPAAGPSR